ncbi:MAG: DMT family transporter [Paracoccaceae bacterium]|nr:MAG: DMT family transporter [Paracoccaceae bacterium]
MNRRLGHLAAAFTGLQVGGGILATRALGDAVGPATLACLRYGVAVLVLALPFALMARAPIPRRDLAGIALLGAAQFALLVWLLNLGLQSLPAAPAALVFATMPAMTLAFAAALAVEPMTPRKLCAMVLVLAGVAAALGPMAVAWGDMPGLLAVAGAAATGALTAIASRPYLARYPTLQVGALAMAAAVAVLALPALAEAPASALMRLQGHEMLLVLAIGLSSGAGYLLWLTALRNLEPAAATLYLGLSPVVAAIAAPWLLGEAAGWGVWAGLALVLAGLRVAGRPVASRLAFRRPRG